MPSNVRDVVHGRGTLGDVVETTYRRGTNERTVTVHGPITVENGTLDGERWKRDANGVTVAIEPEPPEAIGEAHVVNVERSTTPDAYVIADLTKGRLRHQNVR